MLPPQPATEGGKDVFNLYLLVLGLALIVFVGVEGFILYAVVRYRRKPGDDVLPEQLHGNTTVEIIWTAIPTVIVFILFTFSMITLGEVDAHQDPGATIEVEGFQWLGRSPIGTNTAPNRFVGFAAVCAAAVNAGTIASSNGSARVAPRPRRAVRREICFL